MKRSSLAFGLKWWEKNFLCLWTCDLNFRKCVSLPGGCGGTGRAWWGGSGLPSGNAIWCCLETQSQELVSWSLISGHWSLAGNKGKKGKLWSGSEFVSWELHGQATVTVRAWWNYPLLDHQCTRYPKPEANTLMILPGILLAPLRGLAILGKCQSSGTGG